MVEEEKKIVKSTNDYLTKHLYWIIGLITITIIICTTLIYLQEHSWIVRFEMDNNTLEAIKSINWSELNGK